MPGRNTGKLADPAFRRQRARKAALARTSIDAHIRAIVDAAPPLTAEQLERLAAIFRTAPAAPPAEGGSSDAAA